VVVDGYIDIITNLKSRWRNIVYCLQICDSEHMNNRDTIFVACHDFLGREHVFHGVQS
jgi:hypothetical protein